MTESIVERIPVITTFLILTGELYMEIITSTVTMKIIRAETIAQTYMLAIVDRIPFPTNIGLKGIQYLHIKS